VGQCRVFGALARREGAASRGRICSRIPEPEGHWEEGTPGRKRQVQLDFRTRELTIKLVYYGPALSGKTTNLQALHRVVDRDATGRLMTLDTKDDRTLFFDLLPLNFKAKSGVSVRIKVFTVPGQQIHASTRRLVVQGADGVVFVADSQHAETQNNATAFLDLKSNLETNGLSLKNLPLVIQFNKRDLPAAAIRTREELDELARRGREPVYLAVATQGTGVVESFLGLLQITWQSLNQQHSLDKKFGFESDAFVQMVANKLGANAPVLRLINTRLGGAPAAARSQGGGA
jgi:signal recognition particle receptor subunit beta